MLSNRESLTKKASFPSEAVYWCSHPDLFPTVYVAPAEMIGPCVHNMFCPTCGFGWGQGPDPCDRGYYAGLRLVNTG